MVKVTNLKHKIRCDLWMGSFLKLQELPVSDAVIFLLTSHYFTEEYCNYFKA